MTFICEGTAITCTSAGRSVFGDAGLHSARCTGSGYFQHRGLELLELSPRTLKASSEAVLDDLADSWAALHERAVLVAAADADATAVEDLWVTLF